MERAAAPSEDEQFENTRPSPRPSAADRPLIIRTLDVGGDKPLAYLPIPKEDNPFLGERGIRVGLDRPEILRTQLRAILRASAVREAAHHVPDDRDAAGAARREGDARRRSQRSASRPCRAASWWKFRPWP